MLVSYIIPHKDRHDLLEKNLYTLARQTDKDFEVVIVDSSINSDKMKSLALRFRRDLQIKVVFIDNLKCPFSHPKEQFGGFYNPAISQNVGVKASEGSIVVLTSPEVINARTNVERIKNSFLDKKSFFILGFVDEATPQEVGDLTQGVGIEKIKEICRKPRGCAMCRKEKWTPVNYFLGAIRKADFIRIGGIEETYMAGIGFEDNCFANRIKLNNITPKLNEAVAGIHLSHPRNYQGNLFKDDNPNRTFWESNKNLIIANQGREWGCSSYIKEIF